MSNLAKTIDFDDYVHPLTLFLYHYRDHSMPPPTPPSSLDYLYDFLIEAPNHNVAEISHPTSLDKFYKDEVGDVDGS
ncbi:hypothetical protein RIF29_16695 [Crotalaria pallida]|uniref:Uncharacterized protein n=1 Tax=Crotalaria pallida TaxID=3830 RepID=A0AAN9IK07_CROPI